MTPEDSINNRIQGSIARVQQAAIHATKNGVDAHSTALIREARQQLSAMLFAQSLDLATEAELECFCVRLDEISTSLTTIRPTEKAIFSLN